MVSGSRYDAGTPSDVAQLAIEQAESTWGTGITALLYAPSLAEDPRFVAWAAKSERSVATPVEARQWVEMYSETDVRDVLPHVGVPTLVAIPAAAGRFVVAQSVFVADHLEHARAIEIPGRDHWPFCDGMEPFLAAVTDFLTDVVHLDLVAPSNRRLGAVLFTDIVSSTERLQAVGDRRWRATLESHDEIAAQAVARRGGRVVKTTGDGTLALFDGPASAVLAALEFVSGAKRIGLSVRAGVHVGELEERGDDIAGIAVHLASRIADRAAPDEVLVSTTVRDLVAGSGLRFQERGTHELKGISGPSVLLAASSEPAVRR
jgi:class 3 adenylate cyclase